MVAWRSPAVAFTIVGVPGAVDGVTEPEELEAAPVPAELTALTVKVYALPLVSPVIVAVSTLPTTNGLL